MMTAEQARWAASHDWCDCTVRTTAGYFVLVRDEATQNGIELPVRFVRFDDYRKLRAFAGY